LKKWYLENDRNKKIEMEKTIIELEMLKAQVHPRFLFNTLNNIDVLIEKDAVKASVYLNKLSGIMRFMLYETKTAGILLEKELRYIEQYIDLQKIRSFSPDFVQYSVGGDAGNRIIAPMIFMPFIENAFKHAVYKKNGTAIFITISIEDAGIYFYCRNEYNQHTLEDDGPGGLGNSLSKKRLELLYPGKHTLILKKESNIFTVELNIFLKKV